MQLVLTVPWSCCLQDKPADEPAKDAAPRSLDPMSQPPHGTEVSVAGILLTFFSNFQCCSQAASCSSWDLLSKAGLRGGVLWRFAPHVLSYSTFV
jgi:hypothetical protein